MDEYVKTRKKRPLRICVISFPMPSVLVVNTLVYSLVEILEPICEKIYVVTSNIPNDKTFSEKIRIKDVKVALHFRYTIHPRWWSTILQFFKVIIIQLKMCWILTKISKDIDAVIFYVGGANLFPPVLMAKILRKWVITLAIGTGVSTKEVANKLSTGGAFFTMFRILESANFSLSDRIGIAMESESLMRFFDLEKYRTKIITVGYYYLDTNLKIKKRLNERENIIGYVGRLSEEKGVLEFARAIPIILSKRNNIRFLIVGSGRLMDDMKNILEKAGCLDKVEFTGWIPHEKIPDYLNEMKFHILPSHTESFGGAAIEAMACGAISIANSVGGLPDVITDGETGFLLKDNQPQTIADKVIEVLEHPELERIQTNAKEFVEKTFSYEKAIERCEKAFSTMVET